MRQRRLKEQWEYADCGEAGCSEAEFGEVKWDEEQSFQAVLRSVGLVTDYGMDIGGKGDLGEAQWKDAEADLR